MTSSESDKPESTSPNAADAPAPRSRRRRQRKPLSWAGRLLLLGFALLILAGIEGSLRLAGFGGSPRLFIALATRKADMEGGVAGGIYTLNRLAIQSFFPNQTDKGENVLGSFRQERILVPKPPEVFRIVMVGESTVEGFPMPRNLTAASFLELILHQAEPAKRVEVVNLGVTAIASFPIRRIAEGAMRELQPDMVVVYGAHNEFFGASGQASLQYTGGSVFMMEVGETLRGTATLQAIQQVVARLRPEEPKRLERALIEVMAGTAYVEPEGPLHASARAALATNWRRVVEYGKQRDIAVVLCTVASNERDMAPLVSSETSIPKDRLDDWRARFTAASDIATSHTLESRKALESLVAEAPTHAMAHHAYARTLEMAGEIEKAAEFYRRARDLDALPWRAARDKNAAIRDVARETGALLADVEATMAKVSAPNAAGWLLFDDHVHPGLRGQVHLAKTVAETIVASGALRVNEEKFKATPTVEALARMQGAHPLERFRVVSMMTSIFEKPPMRLNNEAAYERFDRDLRRMIGKADGLEKSALLNWDAAAKDAGKALPISYFMGAQALRMQRLKEARIFLSAAILNEESISEERVAAQLLDLCTRGLLGELNPEQFNQRLEMILGQAAFVEVLPGQPSPLLCRSVGALYLLRGNREKAMEYFARGAEKESKMDATTRAYLRELPPVERLEDFLGAVTARLGRSRPPVQEPASGSTFPGGASGNPSESSD